MRRPGPARRPTRRLRLRGGALDGVALTADIDVGSRIDCGNGEWSSRNVYVVTDESLHAPDGGTEYVAIPAGF